MKFEDTDVEKTGKANQYKFKGQEPEYG